jgi:hypothetical protein
MPGTHVGVIGVEGSLADLQGLLQFSAGIGQIPKLPQYTAKVVVPGSQLGVVAVKGGLAYLKGPLVFGTGPVRSPSSCSPRPSSLCR